MSIDWPLFRIKRRIYQTKVKSETKMPEIYKLFSISKSNFFILSFETFLRKKERLFGKFSRSMKKDTLGRISIRAIIDHDVVERLIGSILHV